MSLNLVQNSTRLAALALLSLASMPASAAPEGVEYPWCMMQGRNTPQSCTFTTVEQCRASLSGGQGFCDRNPRYDAARQRPAPRR
jgi:hypothetical protein